MLFLLLSSSFQCCLTLRSVAIVFDVENVGRRFGYLILFGIIGALAQRRNTNPLIVWHNFCMNALTAHILGVWIGNE